MTESEKQIYREIRAARDASLARIREAQQLERQKKSEERSAQRALELENIRRSKEAQRLAGIEERRKKSEGSDTSYGPPAPVGVPKTTIPKSQDPNNLEPNRTPPQSTKTTKNEDEFGSPNLNPSAASGDSLVKKPWKFVGEGDIRKFTQAGVATIDTINNIGSLMNDRITKNVKKSLSKMYINPASGESNTYTPIAYQTLKLAEELGLQGPFADDKSFASMLEAETGASPEIGGDRVPLKNRDNSMGNSWVVNPPFQFNENDDVRSNLSFPKFGRVYNEKINANYPIVVFEVGTIKYNESLLNNTLFQSNDSNTKFMNSIRGDGSDLNNIIGFPLTLAGSVLKTSWNIVTWPLLSLDKLLGLRKFAIFQPTTGIFAKYFNDFAQNLATMLGLLVPLDIAKDYAKNVSYDDIDPDVTSNAFIKGMKDIFKDVKEEDTQGSYAGKTGRILFECVVPGNLGSAESDYIPFLAGKDVGISESVSNSTQGNPLAANLNAAAAEAAAAAVNNDSNGGTDKNALDATKDMFAAKTKRMANSMLKGTAQTVISGEGRITLPDMWSDSSFSRSVSLNFTFTSPYGHTLSIFENTYIPFLLLFCMTLPRQIGAKTFTNPFFIRAHMKGMFYIPMGIVESLSIERGDDKNNWTTENIPRTIKCSMSIKDLSPVLMMSMSQGKIFPLFLGNDGFGAYLNTLGGLSLKEQRSLSDNFKFWSKRITERARAKTDGKFSSMLLYTINPLSYAEPFIRGARSGIIGRTIVKLSQAGLNPLDVANTDKRNY